MLKPCIAGLSTRKAISRNLLYMSLYGKTTTKEVTFSVMTERGELSNYCQASGHPTHSRKYAEALQNPD
jgi:hypothetical protein